jgi:uncharacterized protein
MKSRATALSLLLILPFPALAETSADLGTLNPDEMSLDRVLEDTENGKITMTNCASGYMMTKSGRHAMARRVFERCAGAGYTGAMTWMSQLDDNGAGAPVNPDRAADWDKMAAEAGDPVGMFNYGLDLMRGRGTLTDRETGRKLVDRASQMGLPVARRLQGADYNLDEVTPDADNWKYAPLF